MAVVPAPGLNGPVTGRRGEAEPVGARPAETGEAIAIIGCGLRFPGGNETLDGFEEFLREGRSGIRPLPRDRWDVDAFTPGDQEEKGKIQTTGGGFLDAIDQFDAPFFGISPLEAQYTDPQQRLLLETAWEALENANVNPAALRHGNGGVYIGASSFDYALELDSLSYPETDGHLASGITPFAMSGRVSYFLGWRGPSLTTDTACASSLTALHLAVAGLRRGECDIALAGAVNALHHPKIFVMFSHANMLAPDGLCKTFDEAADGYVRAEGCAVLVLKRLADAQRDGDSVLALIRGTAIGQDGESAGLTVPNGTAQEQVMRNAIAAAGLVPGDISYVEAHGTGTPLGDPIEMGAISDVFADSHTSDQPVVVASLKTNLGHMEPAAGLGGVLKTVLQMRAGTIFPHLNFRTPSGRIPWSSIPVTVPTANLPWTARPRRAVVSSFGFAGSIAAAVLEEPPAAGAGPGAADHAADGAAADGGHVLTMSAKSKRSFGLLVERYQQFLAAHPEARIEDVCYTANVGRSHFQLRQADVVRGRQELDSLLAKWRDQEVEPGGLRKVAFLFAGQGAQYPGMGAALYRQFPVFRAEVDACDAAFAPHLGRSIKEVMFGGGADAEELQQTRSTQPALFTLEYALARLWLSWGIRPNVMIGHSIGEVAAAAVAGLFSLDDAARLVAARGRLMQSVAAPGGMAAVSAAAADIAPLLEPYADLALAAINSPGQCVISGGLDSLDEVTRSLAEQGLTVKRLAVSHAFHSPLMEAVFDEFREVLAGIRFREPSLTLISNVTGKAARTAEISNPEYWVRHIGDPVNFEAGMTAVERRGRHVFIEIGPSRALTAMARQCVAPQDHGWVTSLARDDQDGTAVREAVAQAYTLGLPVSWTGFHQGREGRKVTLPGYAFDRKRYWLPLKGKRHGLGGAAATGPARHPLLGEEVTSPEQRAAGSREFSALLRANSPAYLADHLVLGRVVFPGTGYLETILALQDAVYGDTHRAIEDAVVLEPLFLSEDEPSEVRTVLTAAADGAAAVRIVSREAGKDGVIERVHLTALLPAAGIAAESDAAAQAARRVTELTGAAGEPDETLSADAVYAAYAAAGLDYGPEFRRISRVDRYGDGLAIGTLRAGLDASPVEHVPPVLVDAATHLFAALAAEDESYLPVRYGRFRLFGKPRAADLRVLMWPDQDPAAGTDLSLNIVAVDGDRPVFELSGLGLKRITGDRAAGRGLVSKVRWVKRSLLSPGEPAEQHVLLVNAGRRATGALAGLAPDNCTVSTAAGAEQASAILGRTRITDVCWFWRPQDGGAAEDLGALRAECEHNYRELLALLAALADRGFGRDQRLWLVTERAQAVDGDAPGPAPAAATLWGFGHSLLNEYPAYRASLVDLPGGEAGMRCLAQEWAARGSREYQVAYRDDVRYVRRLIPARPAGREADDNFRLAVTEYGQFSAIKAVAAPDVPPGEGEIQVSVAAAGLNFKDVLNALGLMREFGDQPLGFEAAGTVIEAGPGADHQVGDDVIINYLGLMQRRVTVPSAVAVRKPPSLSFVQAAGLSSVYVTAYYALHTLAGIKAGDRVLIHAAAGGVGQAAVQLAKAAGAEVFATASPHKWPVLHAQGIDHVMSSRSLDFADEIDAVTGGQGVDIVLNSLNKDFIGAGFRSLGRGGRFVEMGKVGAWSAERVREERPDVTYHTFDLSELPLDEGIAINAAIMRTVVGKVAAGELPPLRCASYSLDEIEEAFGVLSRGANIGKLVLDFDAGQPRANANANANANGSGEFRIRADRSYLITGGLGGLGLVTAAKLAELGARHIVLLSRSADPDPSLNELLARLRRKAEVTVQRGDVAEPADVAGVIGAVQASPHPLAGIIHAAGTLADAPVAGQSWETIDRVFRPKVYGSWLLHEAAKTCPDLDFFVGYSSAAPVTGASGQANYAAANAFLDDLLVRYAAAGGRGLSINWGPWREVGMSARLSDQVLKKWAEEGIRLLAPRTGVRLLAALLDGPIAQALVGDCDWDRFAASRPVPNAIYDSLLTGAAADGEQFDVAELIAASKGDRLAALEGYVRARVAAVLHFDGPESVDSGTEFVRLGLDSLVAVELKNTLESALRLPLPPTLALDYPSVQQLAEFLEQQLAPEPAG
jgi:acyl transferase domain-containing protein/acyl carrier protein